MNRPCVSNIPEPGERDDTEAKTKWLDLISVHEYADLARGFFDTHHDAWDAFLRDIDREFQMARKFRSEP
jgi:hypothetical protein